MTSIDSNTQQPCSHCGDCARACPEKLNPETLFFDLVGDHLDQARQHRLDACTECNRCAEVCPSNIPLVDWFRWGKSELRERERADAARTRFLARDKRLARDKETRAAQRDAKAEAVDMPAQTISKSDVLAAIARGKEKRAGRAR